MKRGNRLSINETNLKRTLRKESDLSKKLIDMRKKRENEETKINRISKKRKVTKSEIQRLENYRKNLLKYDEKIMDLMKQIQKNNTASNKYKLQFDKQKQREYEKMMKDIQSQTKTRKNYINSISEVSEKLNELAIDVKETAQEKEIIEYDVFLSHSNLDKDIFVTELSEKLSGKNLNVFEDVKVFKIGQSQTDMMNMGIINSRFVVVFLSPNFIQSGWSDYEFKSFLNREINENKIIILPIWHEVSVEEVRNYNPYLVDKFALSTEKYTADEMVEHIAQVINQSKE